MANPWRSTQYSIWASRLPMLSTRHIRRASSTGTSSLRTYERESNIGISTVCSTMKDLVLRNRSQKFSFEILHRKHSFHFGPAVPVELLHNASLHINGGPLVYPEVAPGSIVNEIARPRMRELMNNQRT